VTATSRVLVCGSRRWPWPDTVITLLNRAAARYSDDLVLIEGASTGAARAAHRWCLDHDLPAWRHRCHPLASATGRRARRYWSEAERNQRILHDEGPRLALAFHEHFTPGNGSTADLCRRALATGIPVWLVPTADPDRGMWLSRGHLPDQRGTLSPPEHAETRSAPDPPGPDREPSPLAPPTSP
jgi:hypothetical protein